MKRLSNFKGLLVIASLIMAGTGVSVQSHPLHTWLDHRASPMTELEDHARPSRSTRDINDNLVRNNPGNISQSFFSPISHVVRSADVRMQNLFQVLRHLFALAFVFIIAVQWDHFVTGELFDEEVEMIRNQLVWLISNQATDSLKGERRTLTNRHV